MIYLLPIKPNRMKLKKSYSLLLALICLTLTHCQKSQQDTIADQNKARHAREAKRFLEVRKNPEAMGYTKAGYDEMMNANFIKYPRGNKEAIVKKTLETFEVYLNYSEKRMFVRRLVNSSSKTSRIAAHTEKIYRMESYNCICSGVAMPEQERYLVDDELCANGGSPGGGINHVQYVWEADWTQPESWENNGAYMKSAVYAIFSLVENPGDPVGRPITEEMQDIIDVTPDNWIGYN